MFNIKNNPFSDLQSLEKLTDSEIITPFEVVKKMVELLPEEVFTNLNNRFIDVSTKSGIYLKYIFFNLLHKLPNIQLSKDNNELDYELDEDYDFTNLDDKKRFILRYMIYGIATSELSFLTSKRTLYENINENEDSEKDGKILSKPIFKNGEGNIVYKKLNNDEYWFLETDIETINKELTKNIKLKKDKEMKFNVIIGNPPYQSGVKQIYRDFIKKSIDINPDYLSLIVPGSLLNGNNNNKIRNYILDKRYMKKIFFYEDGKEVFRNAYTKSDGICYFYLEKKKSKETTIIELKIDNKIFKNEIVLTKNNIWFNMPYAIEIIDKINKIDQLSDNNWSREYIIPDYKIKHNFENNIIKPSKKFKIKVYLNKNRINYIESKPSTKIENNSKIVISESHGANFKNGKILPPLKIIDKNSIVSDSYRIIYSSNDNNKIENAKKYIETKFFRYLSKISKTDQHNVSTIFQYVPILDMNKEWTDEELYKRYNLTEEEISYIEENIKEMK